MSEIVIFSPILRKDLTLRLKYLASEISQTIQMHFILKPLKHRMLLYDNCRE